MLMKKTILWLCLLVLSAAALVAQEVTAGLSSPTSVVGQPVELVITVRDARGADVPQTIGVQGLRIELIGRATRFEMNNLKVTSSLTFTYSVVPANPGEFTIPPVEVKVGNKALKTNPARLSVLAASQMPATPVRPQQAPVASAGQFASDATVAYFGELLLSKNKAYVGEVIPAELRYYFNSRISGEVGDRPNFGGEGFTVQKFANVPKREQIVNSENYIVFGFQTALAPAKTGTLDVPASTLGARLQIPGSAPAGFADLFRQFGGTIPQGMFTESREVSIETKPTRLEVLPLPKEGKPVEFSGAIGKFKMEASVSPMKAAPGDPVTLKVLISGQGNFDAMGAPVLVDDEGWRSYPPVDKFQSADAIHYTGEKAFDFVLVARQDQTQTPAVRFSFFDPATGKYETLTQTPLPVDAKAGGSTVVAAPQSKMTSPTPAVATPTPVSMASSRSSGGATSWGAFLLRPDFLMCNAALAGIWVLGLLWMLIRKLKRSSLGARFYRQRGIQEKLTSLKACDAASFDSLATECMLQVLECPNDLAKASHKLQSTSSGEVLQQMLDRLSESKYSAYGSRVPSVEERQRIIDALAELISLYAK